jgi:hypothetical protein
MGEADFAKVHLKDHLNSLLISPISEGFWSIHTSAKELCERNDQPDQILRTFQNMLTKIPDWTDATLSTEVERILKVTKCSYLDDLIMGVFISYMKAFASLQQRNSSDEIKIEFDRPSLAKFIHELYKQSARKMWQTAYLFKVAGTTSEVQARNRQEIETIISNCIELVIRSFLPWESITKKYFSEGQSEPSHSVPEPEPPVVEEKRVVKFEEEDESEEEENMALVIGEEVSMNLVDDEEEDPLKEIEKRVSDSLVLNL